MEFTPPCSYSVHTLFISVASPFCFFFNSIQLQLAYKLGSSSSHRALLLSALSYASPISVISRFPFLRSSFLVLPVPAVKVPLARDGSGVA